MKRPKHTKKSLSLQSPLLGCKPPTDDSDDKNWIRGDLIDAGAFGKVYKGRHGQTGELCAMKVIPLDPHSPASRLAAIDVDRLRPRLERQSDDAVPVRLRRVEPLLLGKRESRVLRLEGGDRVAVFALQYMSRMNSCW